MPIWIHCRHLASVVAWKVLARGCQLNSSIYLRNSLFSTEQKITLVVSLLKPSPMRWCPTKSDNRSQRILRIIFRPTCTTTSLVTSGKLPSLRGTRWRLWQRPLRQTLRPGHPFTRRWTRSDQLRRQVQNAGCVSPGGFIHQEESKKDTTPMHSYRHTRQQCSVSSESIDAMRLL